MMFSPVDRGLAALATAYCAYRLWSGTRFGVVSGDGDADVHADKNPAAYILTMLSIVFLLGLFAFIALGL